MRLIVLFIAAALFFSCNAEKKHQTSGKQEPNSTPQTQRVDTLFAQIDFPTTIASVIEKLGAPDSTYIDRDEFCPLGQLHYWDFLDKNFQLVVLGHTDSTAVDYAAESGLIVIRRKASTQLSDFAGIFGIQLGDTEADVKTRLEAFLQTHEGYILETFTAETPIDRFMIEQIGTAYWLTDENIFFHFVFSTTGTLEYIIQCDFNLRAVC